MGDEACAAVWEAVVMAVRLVRCTDRVAAATGAAVDRLQPCGGCGQPGGQAGGQSADLVAVEAAGLESELAAGFAALSPEPFELEVLESFEVVLAGVLEEEPPRLSVR